MDMIPVGYDAYAWIDLSDQQRAVWLDMQLLDTPVGYQLSGWARFDFEIDLEITRQAVSLVMARHDALRLRIDPYQPRQRVDASVEPPLFVRDLDPGDDAQAAFDAYAHGAFLEPIPLGELPLFQVDLLRAGSSWFMLFRFHHLIADALSTALLMRRWLETYLALTDAAVSELAPPTSFVAKLATDAEKNTPQAQQATLAYWKQRFETLPEPLLPRLAPSARMTGAQPPTRWTLTGTDYVAFADACKFSGLTTQRTLVALLAMVLARIYGQTRVGLGIALHRRDFASRDLIGMLAAVLPVPCTVDPDDTLSGNATAISAMLDRDFRHERMSIDALGRALGRRPDAGGALFEATISHLIDETPAESRQDLAAASGMWRGPEAMPLALYVTERRQARELAFELTRNGALVDAQAQARVAKCLRQAVQNFVEDPYLTASELVAMSDVERETVVQAWNAPAQDFPIASLPVLLARQVAATPEGVALVDAVVTLSYGELDAASDRLAAVLQAGGIGPGDVVGVALGRSVGSSVAAWAVLKAGGVYLPLDLAYPAARLALMLGDAGAALVITEAGSARHLPDDVARVLVSDSVETRFDPPVLDAEQTAYVIYTSGSTGVPKGVAVSHAAAANLAAARRAAYDPAGPGDRVLAASAIGFDVSIVQLLLVHLSGAAVIVAPELRTLSAQHFWRLIADARVSHINLAPSVIDAVLDAMPNPATLAVRQLMLGGEALSGALCARIRAALPGVTLVNVYGPTETCIEATAHVVPDTAPGDAPEPVQPIGRALGNYRAYVLDARLRPLPVGVPGQLYIAGAGLAQGYLGQPGLTAARFIADPFSPTGGRLYDTGDRALWRPDGTLGYLGRADTQIKIRGQRVEPGEIEAALRSHPAVARAAVIAPDGRLVAYLVTTAAIGSAELRAHLAPRLPAHMIPAAWVTLDALPLTPNGKLDTKALPAPTYEATQFVAPRDATEAAVAGLFAELLGVAPVGAHDDFFALGGHSLLATRLVLRLRSDLAAELSLHALFAGPTVAAIAANLVAAGSEAAIPVAARPAQVPLSFGQERLWFLDRLDPEASAYIMPSVLRLHGRLDAGALQAALAGSVARHEILRTRIEIHDGMPHQVVDAGAFTLEQVDLSEDAAALDGHVARLVTARFDLAAGLPIRAALLRLGADEHVLALAIHHIAGDGWSMGVLLGEVAAQYAAATTGVPSPLAALPIQYADVALWQRAQLADGTLDRQLEYWRGALDSVPDTLDLPLDRPRSATRSARAAVSVWSCDAALTGRLRGVARRSDATLFMLMLTAMQAVLARWSGQSDLVVGTPVAQRTRPETASLIGFFVNTLALRARLTPGLSFADALGRGRETLLAGLAHQDAPFERVVEAVGAARTASSTPLIQTMVALEPVEPAQPGLAGLRLEPVGSAPVTAKFDLTLALAEQPDGSIAGGFEYAADLFDAATIARLGTWLTRLLHAVAADPAIALDDIDLFDAALPETAPAQSFPIGPLPVLLARQVAATPEGVALVDAVVTLSYGELDAASDRLAAVLQAGGVGPGDVVGVALGRSVGSSVAAWAVLKAGGVYLPLDLAYPAARLALMLGDAGAALVITEAGSARHLPDDVARVLVSDSVETRFDPPVLDAEQTAYVIYTSGSTGVPKGVAVSHAAAANLAAARRAAYDPAGPGDRVLAASAIGFDVSIVQLLLVHLSGAAVIVAPELRTLSAQQFWRLIADARVSHINLAPSVIDAVLDAMPDRATLAVRQLMLGGEALSGALCARIRAALPGVTLVNVYGPTETCIEATAHVVPDTAPGDAPEPVQPIGRALGNYRAYVLDARLRPLPVGVPGQLYIAGAGLAQGYLGQPGLTAARFIADPFSSSGGRLYDTGDRALWRPDGTLGYLGRADTQIKIRGQRVEPGEIEAALRSHPAVARAAVIAPDGRLVAYLVTTAAIGSAELRAHLAPRLPAHMIPAAWVTLDALPLTPNGKLDTKALPAPTYEATQFVAPRDATEAAVAGLFAELLGVAPVGAHDDFFALGGHSLLATRLVLRLRSDLAAELSLHALFAGPTVAAIAANLVAAGSEAAIPVAARPAQVPLSFGQERLWFLDRLDPEASAYIMPSVLRLHGRLDAGALQAALAGSVARHEILRTRIEIHDGMPHQVVDAGAFTLEQVDLSEDAAALDGHVARLVTARFDLAAGLPIRAALLRLGADEHVLALAIHHIAGDGWSMGVLLGEVAAQYAAATTGVPSPLAALPIQYADVALWQRAQLADGTLDRQLEYWRGALDSVPDTLDLPLDRPRSATRSARAAVSVWSCDAALTGRLRGVARRSDATLFMLMLTAMQAVLARWSGQSDLVVGTPVAQRTRPETASLIGFFVNTLALRARLTPGLSFADALGRGRETLLAGLAHQDAPFERVVEAVGAARTASSTPLIQTMVALEPVEPAQPGLAGVRLEPVGSVPVTAKFDLTLALAEQPDGSIAGGFEYAADLFDAATIARLGTWLTRLLHAVAADPAIALDDIDLFDAALPETAPAQSFPIGPLPVLLARQVAATPEGVALVDAVVTLSYGELDAASDRLAAVLQASGVGPGDVVGVALGRSVGSSVAAWAVLKAGGVYLPLDLAYPAARLALMLGDAGAALVITEAGSVRHLPDDVARVLVSDSVETRFDPPVLDAEQTAYVIYTSGSTGVPKGVAVSHAAAANLAAARRAAYDPAGPGDRVLAASAIGFDVSIVQLLLVHLSGAAVIVAPELRTLSAQHFWRLIADARVSHINLAPSVIDAVLDAMPNPATLAVRQLMLGGEALSGALCARIRAALPGVTLVNVYGPTETCIEATAHVVPDTAPGDAPEPVQPIGRALGNYRAYVLDARLRPLPVGVPGQLYIAGAGLAQGYLGQPGLTAARFIADPFSPTGGRLYDTGDRALWRPDGTLGYLGRADTQIKIRGQRVEPGEIEAALRSHPAVARAAVIAPDGRLVAYLVTTAAIGSAELRAHLAPRLPAHMIPAAWVTLDALPLTPNGKLDTKALPAPTYEATQFVAPRDATEAAVAGLFAELLGVAPVGAHDDFFALGGHSLLATRLVLRLRSDLAAELSLHALFAGPTVAAIAANLVAAGSEAAIPVAARPAQVPLSFGQERLWFLDRLDPEASAYIMPSVLRLHGRLDAGALQAALAGSVARHEILRTRIEIHDGMPHQVVDAGAFTLEQVDLSEDAAALDGHVARLVTARFDLAAGLPIRAALLRLGADEHVLALAIHHIAGDGWSMGVLLGEVAAQYAAATTGVPSPLAALPIQYADVALWQRAQLADGTLDRQLEYWRGALDSVPDTLDLPLDRPRSATRSARAAVSVWSCDAALTGRLRGVARRSDATLFMLMLTAMQAVLARWSGQSDLVVGTPVAQRTRPETASLIGFFVNTLALRARLTPGLSFADALGRGRETLLAGLAHQDAPFERVVEAVGAARTASSTPLIQTMVALEPVEPAQPGLAGLRLEPVGSAPVTAKFDLTLALAEQPDGSIAGGFEYAADLFDAATIARLGTWLTRLLHAVAADPAIALDDIDLFDAALPETAPAQDFPIGPLPVLLARQVAATPEGVALVDAVVTLSYGELDAASDRLAAVLQAGGVGPGDVVGVALGRSVGSSVAAWAVLKAGGVYLPLDLAYPAARLALMLGDAGAALVITEAGSARHLPDDVARVLVSDSVETRFDPPVLDAEQTAYVIYTSGSTGVPKGVAVSHAAAANLAAARRAAYDPAGPGDRVLAASAIGFDVSIVQLLLLHLSGAAVIVAPELRTLSAQQFWRLIVDARVSHINLAPSVIDAVLDAMPDRATLAVRQLMLGGEALSGALCARIRAALPGVTLVNVYGPTETCIEATAHVVPDTAPGDAPEPVQPIGRALGNYRAYVLDARLRPLPVGVPGQLYIAGAGLAQGYLGQPGLTAARFIADPFSSSGGRLYDTGDRALWRPDGTLGYLGRADTQIKIRGQRVEPGEIEAALRSHPAVARAAVIAPDGRLVAYLVTTAAIGSAELRAHLAPRLPAHMIPAAWVTLDALPLTPNGKLDTRALPAPTYEATQFVAPRDATEARLLAIWRELLGVEDLSATDDFFLVGGNSLSGIRLISRCETEFGVSVPVAALFSARTIVDQASLIRSHGTAASSRLVTLRAGAPDEAPLICVHPLGGTIFCLDPLARALPKHLPVMGLQAAGLVAGEMPAASIEAMADDYIGIIRAAGLSGPYRLLGYSFGGVVAYEMARRLIELGETVELLTMLDTARPDDPTLPRMSQQDLLATFASELGLPAGRELYSTVSDLFAKAQAAGALPPGASQAQAERLFAINTNNLDLFERYTPPAPIAVRLLQVRALNGQETPIDWSDLIIGSGVTTIELPCTHGELCGSFMASPLAEGIQAALNGKVSNDE